MPRKPLIAHDKVFSYSKVPIAQVHPNAWNPNSMEEDMFNALVKSIKKSKGNDQFPILVREDKKNGGYEIVDGEHRHRACGAAGMKEVSVVVENLDDKEAMIQTLAMNRLRGKVDPKKLAKLLDELQTVYGVTMKDFETQMVFSSEEIEGMKTLLEVDAASLVKEPKVEMPPEVSEGSLTYTFSLMLTPDQKAKVELALDLADKGEPGASLCEVAAFYLNHE